MIQSVVLFDIDGTLLSSGGAGQAAMEQALREEFNAHRPVSGITTFGRTDRAIMQDLFEYYDVAVTPDNWERFKRGYLSRLPWHLQTLGGEVLPGCRQLVEDLVARSNVLVGLLTGNLKEGAIAKLRHFEMNQHFSFGGYGDHHADRDDVARDARAEVAQRLPNFADAAVWVVGDTPNDVKCARAIGAKVLAVATGHFSDGELLACAPDFVANNLADVNRWAETLSTP